MANRCYVLKGTFNFNGTPVHLDLYLNEKAASDVEAKIAARAFKKAMDSMMITGEMDGYDITMSRGPYDESIHVVDKCLYHRQKGDMEFDEEEDSGE